MASVASKSAVDALYTALVSKSASPSKLPALIKNVNPNSLVEYDTSSILMTAVAQGNKEAVKTLLAKNPEGVNYKVPFNGQTALMRAVQVGNKEMVEMLMKLGADPSITAKDGRYALQFFNIRAGDHTYRDVLATEMIKQINSGALNEGKMRDYLLALKAYVRAAGTKYFNSMAEKISTDVSAKTKAKPSAGRRATSAAATASAQKRIQELTQKATQEAIKTVQEDPVWNILMQYYDSPLLKSKLSASRSATARASGRASARAALMAPTKAASAPALLHRRTVSARAASERIPREMPPLPALPAPTAPAPPTAAKATAAKTATAAAAAQKLSVRRSAIKAETVRVPTGAAAAAGGGAGAAGASRKNKK
jgi:hypothetical protein